MPLYLEYILATGLIVFIVAFFISINYLIMKGRLKRPAGILQNPQYRFNLCEYSLSVSGRYRGRPVEIKIVSYTRAPYSVIVSVWGNCPVGEFHITKNRKGNIVYYQGLTKGFIPKPTIKPGMEDVLNEFYQKNKTLFDEIFSFGFNSVSVLKDRVVMICRSSFWTKRQRNILNDTFRLQRLLERISSLERV